MNYIAVRSLACLPAGLLALYFSLSFSISHLSLALSVSWPRPYLPALAARWDNDGHLVNRKHRFSLRLYKAGQREVARNSSDYLIFDSHFVLFTLTFIWNNYYLYRFLIFK